MDGQDAQNVLFTANRLAMATGREPGIPDTDAGENR